MTETADKSTKRSFCRSWHLVFFSIATLLLIAPGVVVWLERNSRDDMASQYFDTTISQGEHREGEAEIRMDGSGNVLGSTQRIQNELTQLLSLVKKKRRDSKSHDPESEDKQNQAYEMEELQYIKMRKKENLFPKTEAETKLKSIIKPPNQQDSDRKQMGMVDRGRGLKRSGRGRSFVSSSDSCVCDFSSGSSSKRSSRRGKGNSCECTPAPTPVPSASSQPSLSAQPTVETLAPTVSQEPTLSQPPSTSLQPSCINSSNSKSSKKSSSSSSSNSLDECFDYSSTGSSDYTYSSTKSSSRGRSSITVDSSSNSRRVLGEKGKVRDFRNRNRSLN